MLKVLKSALEIGSVKIADRVPERFIERGNLLPEGGQFRTVRDDNDFLNGRVFNGRAGD